MQVEHEIPLHIQQSSFDRRQGSKAVALRQMPSDKAVKNPKSKANKNYEKEEKIESWTEEKKLCLNYINGKN